jgi:hypothetical protein
MSPFSFEGAIRRFLLASWELATGEPELTHESVIECEIKFSGHNGPCPEINRDDFALKKEVVELFEQLTRMGTGTIRELSIKAGLPFLMRVEH